MGVAMMASGTIPPFPMLVSCVAYEQGRKIADIPVADVSEYVNRPDCFVWVALFEPTQAELDEIAEEFGLHELAVEDARKGHQRPKIEEYGDSLFAVLHPVEIVRLDDGTDELRIGEVSIFVGKNYVLTVRDRKSTRLNSSHMSISYAVFCLKKKKKKKRKLKMNNERTYI